MPPIHRDTPKNGLLAALSPEDVERFFSDLQPVSFLIGHVFYDVGTPFENVYFIEQGLASVLTNLTNGSMIGVGMIGMEGVVGVPVLLGDETSAQRVIVQVPGTALRMKAAPCKAAFDESAAVRGILLRFAAARLNFSAQTAACNRVHSIKQRCARWLLMSSDRIRSDVMPMTHEFLSSMLGVRRTGVTAIAGELQRSELIRYHRGQVTIVDHAGLEAAACECYRIDQARLEQRL
jgi:CRP-like cAMP-binding protein